MNRKIKKLIDKKILKVMSEYDEKFTTYKIKVKARKDGEMENGQIFCHKDRLYDAEFAFETGNKGSEEDWYDVEDETYEYKPADAARDLCCPHGMDAEFFNEYFIVVS